MPTPPQAPSRVSFPFARAEELIVALEDLEQALAELESAVGQVEADLPATMQGRTAGRLETEMGQVRSDLVGIRGYVSEAAEDVRADIWAGEAQQRRYEDDVVRYERELLRWRTQLDDRHG